HAPAAAPPEVALNRDLDAGAEAFGRPCARLQLERAAAPLEIERDVAESPAHVACGIDIDDAAVAYRNLELGGQEQREIRRLAALRRALEIEAAVRPAQQREIRALERQAPRAQLAL